MSVVFFGRGALATVADGAAILSRIVHYSLVRLEDRRAQDVFLAGRHRHMAGYAAVANAQIHVGDLAEPHGNRARVGASIGLKAPPSLHPVLLNGRNNQQH